MSGREVTTSPALVRLFIFLTLAAGVFIVVRPFLVAITWGLVIAVTSWPINVHLRRVLPARREGLAAGIMTLVLVLILIGLVVPFSFELASEITRSIALIKGPTGGGEFHLPDALIQLPVIGDYLHRFLLHSEAKAELFRLLDEYQPQMISAISFAARGIGGFLFTLGVTIFSSYFFFRYGDVLAGQLIVVARRMGGAYYVELLDTIWVTVRGVVFGVVITAITQGVLAGIGFYVCGAPIPILLGVLTVILGLVPFGPPFLYLPVALFLYLSGAPWYYAIGLAAWGVAVVSTVDNVIRPFFISQATSLSVLLAFFGGLGGIAAFGMVGLFVGPVVLALAQTIWLKVVSGHNSAGAVGV